MSSGDFDKKKCPNCGNYNRVSSVSSSKTCLSCGTEINKNSSEEDKVRKVMKELASQRRHYEEARERMSSKGLYERAFKCDNTAEAFREAVDIAFQVYNNER